MSDCVEKCVGSSDQLVSLCVCVDRGCVYLGLC